MKWKIFPEVEAVNAFANNTLASHIGIEVVEIGPDFIKAKMPVDHRTKQPMGLLHGGASVVLSETIGSMASWLVYGDQNVNVVGIEVNANHIKSVGDGYVTSITRPVKLGGTIHIWNTEIFDENDQLICVSRLTVMIRKKLQSPSRAELQS